MLFVHIFLTVILVIISVVLMFLILIQRSKGEGLGGAFGMGGGSDTVLGSRVSVLQKYTAVLVGAFMILCFVLSVLPPAAKQSTLLNALPAATTGADTGAPVVPPAGGESSAPAAGEGSAPAAGEGMAPDTGAPAGEGAAAPEGAAPEGAAAPEGNSAPPAE